MILTSSQPPSPHPTHAGTSRRLLGHRILISRKRISRFDLGMAVGSEGGPGVGGFVCTVKSACRGDGAPTS